MCCILTYAVVKVYKITQNKCLRTRYFPLEDLIRFLQTPKEAEFYCLCKVVPTTGLYCMFRL